MTGSRGGGGGTARGRGCFLFEPQPGIGGVSGAPDGVEADERVPVVHVRQGHLECTHDAQLQQQRVYVEEYAV